jgi:hypothetical protein
MAANKQTPPLWTEDRLRPSRPAGTQVRVQGSALIGRGSVQSQCERGSALLQWPRVSPSDVHDGTFWTLSRDARE